MRTRRDDANSTVILREHPEVRLRERLEYGDGGDPHQASGEREDARAKNQLARLHRHYDEAGLLIFESYDFKGNILEKTRQVISDRALLRVFDTRTDGWHVEGSGVAWPSDQRSLQAYAEAVLDSDIYRTSFTYDASNRVQTMQYPDDADRGRKLLRERYSRSGALQGVDIDGATFVEHIAYNARGQRTLIAYGNRVMTRYAYDPSTLRLSRLRTERYAPPDGLSFNPAGTVFQDFAYTYDITGNLLNIADITPRCGVRNNPDSARAVYGPLAPLLVTGDALVRRFKYDPLYRLVFATGRECRNTRRPRPWPEFTASHHPWPDDPSCGFNASSHADQDNAPNLTALYEEEYYYDPAGNMLRLKHSRRLNHSNSGDSWTRHFGMGGLTPEQWNQEWAGHLGIDWPNAPGNQATHVGNDLPRVSQSHFYDSSGNLVRENNERHFEWDHSDRLRVFRTQTRSSSGALSEPSVHVQYLYDSTGARVKKLARTSGGGYESTVYVDGIFEHQRWEHNGQASGQNSHLHVMDDQKRIAIVRVGEQHPDDRGPEIQYHLADHLSSSNLVIDAAGGWINREEFAPHGEAIFGSFSKKRYRFSGKERDEESGLYYHGARYYAPWLARWANCDPAGAGAGINVFSYVNNEPIRWRDPTGNNSEPPPWNIEIGPYKSGENPVEGHHIAQYRTICCLH